MIGTSACVENLDASHTISKPRFQQIRGTHSGAVVSARSRGSKVIRTDGVSAHEPLQQSKGHASPCSGDARQSSELL